MLGFHRLPEWRAVAKSSRHLMLQIESSSWTTDALIYVYPVQGCFCTAGFRGVTASEVARLAKLEVFTTGPLQKNCSEP